MKKHNSNIETNLTQIAQLIVAPCWQKWVELAENMPIGVVFEKRIDWEMGIWKTILGWSFKI
jgi:hypothetical protein